MITILIISNTAWIFISIWVSLSANKMGKGVTELRNQIKTLDYLTDVLINCELRSTKELSKTYMRIKELERHLFEASQEKEVIA